MVTENTYIIKGRETKVISYIENPEKLKEILLEHIYQQTLKEFQKST
ncbi:hypothetical protein FACS1894208_05080 [Clostridia bacterium]|nr:hypothetical protein FACS1894208_05080 [Clostridia bacterium]